MTMETANAALRKSKLAWSDAVYKMRGTVHFPKHVVITPCKTVSRTILKNTPHGIVKTTYKVNNK